MALKKSFTVIVVPDHDSKVKRYRIERSFVKQVSAGLAAFAILFLAIAGHYLYVAKDASESQVLREENATLRNQLKSVREKVEHIGATLDRMERFDQRLRNLTQPADPQKGDSAIADDLLGRRGSSAGSPLLAPGAPGSPRLLGGRLDKLSAEAARQEQGLEELHAYFQEQRSLLASTPSLWPARGWVTSDFGQRLDPYTADRVMHGGMDIAAPHGKEVFAPSEGTVVFAGADGGYGNVLVIDHGYGIKTRYGHLAKVVVKVGEHIRRGQLIGAIGNTGRSTGPHLHYEVRVNGIAQNPRKFILED